MCAVYFDTNKSTAIKVAVNERQNSPRRAIQSVTLYLIDEDVPSTSGLSRIAMAWRMNCENEGANVLANIDHYWESKNGLVNGGKKVH